MPRTGSTVLKPNPTRPVLSDLRSMVIGTNALILGLTEQVSALVQGQNALLAALTEMVVKTAKSSHAVAAERHLTPAEQGTMHRALMRSTRLVAAGDTIIGAEDEREVDETPVPRGTPEILASFAESSAEYGEKMMVAAFNSDYTADMAAELAEYAAQDDELPEQDDDDLWSRRLSLHRAMRMWKPEWGAMPGHAGCQVPPHLLNGRG